MVALRDSSVGLEGQRPSELVDEVAAYVVPFLHFYRLPNSISIVQRTHRKVTEWAQLSQLRSFFQQSEIKQGIDRLHREIDAAMQNINVHDSFIKQTTNTDNSTS